MKKDTPIWFGMMLSILITTIFVSYIIGVSDAFDVEYTFLHNPIVSCEPELPCDYTSVGSVALGFALSAGVAISVYYKQRQISKKLDDHAASHRSIANDEIPPYLESIHEVALTWFEQPLPSKNFQNIPAYRLVMRNIRTIRDIYLISGSFLNPDLLHDLVYLFHWIENDFQFLIPEGNIVGYYQLRTQVKSILDNYFRFDNSGI